VLDLRASGGAGGTRLEEAESRLSVDGKSSDLLGDANSFSKVPESRLDGLLPGGGGRGLFSSEDLRSNGAGMGDVSGLNADAGKFGSLEADTIGSKSEKETIWGPFGATALPCRWRGGGGLTLTLFLRSRRPGLSSSSEMDSSYDVRGVSEAISWTCSSSDCRLTEDVSVLLLLSASVIPCGFGNAPVDWPIDVVLPVIRRFLKASTSMEARGMLFFSTAAGPVLSRL
jgi:hypothetical protein